MNIRQARLGVDIFTGLVVASVGVALAGLTWRVAGYSGARPVTAPRASGRGESADISGLLALAPFGNAEAASDTASDGSLHLKGILLATPAAASTALIAGADNKVTGYGIGAALGGGVIEAIAADQVILRTPHGLQTIGFAPAATSRAAPLAGAAGKGAGFVPVGTGAGTSAQPGFKVGDSIPPALLSAGLQPGDIVEELNGAPIAATMSADTISHELAAAALHGGSAQAVVLRKGSRVSLHLEIH